MNRVCLCLLLAFFFSGAQAQLFNIQSKDVKKLKERKLIIVLPEERKFFIEKFSNKPEKLTQYKKIIHNTGELLQRVFSEYWTISPEIIVAKESELQKYKPDSSFLLVKYLFDDKVFNLTPGLNDYQIRQTIFNDKMYGKLEFVLPEREKNNVLLSFFVPTSYPFEADIIPAVSQWNYFILIKSVQPGFSMKAYERVIEDSSFKLAKKVLLIDSAQVEKQLGSFKFVKEEYPYRLKLTGVNEVVSAINSKDSSSAYIAVFPHFDQLNRGGTYEGTAGGGMDSYSSEFYFTHLVIDCATLEIIGIGRNIEPIINKRALKHYIKYID